jgi:hypothetical protein
MKPEVEAICAERKALLLYRKSRRKRQCTELSEERELIPEAFEKSNLK